MTSHAKHVFSSLKNELGFHKRNILVRAAKDNNNNNNNKYNKYNNHFISMIKIFIKIKISPKLKYLQIKISPKGKNYKFTSNIDISLF